MGKFRLRPFQKLALRSLCESNHVLCVAPTGSGKSLIFHKYAQVSGRKTLFITPLVALGRQQARRFEGYGLKVTVGAGSFSEAGRSLRPDSKTDVWIASPEMLFDEAGRVKPLKDWTPEFLVVDECHCVWEWGESFRPEFSHLPDLIEAFRIEKSIWATATLPYQARRSLRNRLPEGLVESGRFKLPDSLELEFRRVAWPDRVNELIRFLIDQSTPGIIFVNTREWTARLVRLIENLGKRAVIYHAGLFQEERRTVENWVERQEPDVVIATSAFGMGMDYRHLNWVVLWQAPYSLLALAQALGRVGRSGQRGRGVVYWDEDDFRMMEWAMLGSERRRHEILQVREFLLSHRPKRELLYRYFEGEE